MKYLITFLLLIRLSLVYSQTNEFVSFPFASNVHFGIIKSDSAFSFFDTIEQVTFFYIDQTYKVERKGVVLVGKYLELRALGSNGSVIYALLPIRIGSVGNLDELCGVEYHFCVISKNEDLKKFPRCKFIFDSKRCLAEIHCMDRKDLGECIHLVSAISGGIHPGELYFVPKALSEAFLHSIVLSGVSNSD